jgi:hypothetical protein
MITREDQNEKRIDTTIGELIEVGSEVAFEHCEDAKEAYTLAGLVLPDMLSNCLRSDLPSSIKEPRQEIFRRFYNNRYFSRCY